MTDSGIAARDRQLIQDRLNVSHVLPSRTRVLHVIQNLNYGGMERLLGDIVRGLDRNRFESHVLVLQYLGRFADGLEDVAQLHVADAMSRLSFLRPKALARQIGLIAPDVVHSHSGVWFKASLAARMAGVRTLIHTEHGRGKPDRRKDRMIDALAARRTDVVVAVSEQLAEQLVATRIARAERVRVIPNGVRTDLFRPQRDDGVLRRDLGLPAHAPVLGSIGRLEPIKGYDLMVEAFAHLVSTWSTEQQPVLIVAGDGSERQRLEDMVDQRGLRGRVYFVGWRSDIKSLHSTFTLFTMSSRSEGTSVSLLEAMSAGLCPVVTNVGGNSAVLGDKLSHRLVPAGNPQALSAAWREALSSPVRLREDAALARRRVEVAFGARAMIRKYEALYATP